MTTANPIVPNGSVWLLMPKGNQNYLKTGFGTSISTSLIHEADLVLNYIPTMRVQYGSVGSTARTQVPAVPGSLYFESDYTSIIGESFDLVRMLFANTVEIPANSLFELVIENIHNPPSLNPITGF